MTYLDITEQSTTQMLDICAESTMNDIIQELRTATVAFLTDRYDDGTYVATHDDIAELREATAAFLADRADGECFCLDPAGEGLLLPGEQFLVPIAEAVTRVRSKDSAVIDPFDLIDECVNAQVSQEEALHTPLLDAAVKNTATAQSIYASSLLATSLLESLGEVLPSHSDLYSALDDLMDLPDGMVPILGKYDFDDGVDTMLNDADPAFNADEALCRSAASDAASFFDPAADAIVPYASLNQLLEMEDEYVDNPCIPELSNDPYADGIEDEINVSVAETVRPHYDD